MPVGRVLRAKSQREKGILGYPFAGVAVVSEAMEYLRAGTHYPRSMGDFQAWFRRDADYLDYLGSGMVMGSGMDEIR